MEGEAADLISATLREFDEETNIAMEQVINVRLRLSTIVSREGSQVVLKSG